MGARLFVAARAGEEGKDGRLAEVAAHTVISDNDRLPRQCIFELCLNLKECDGK
jgi:hypothetical protein